MTYPVVGYVVDNEPTFTAPETELKRHLLAGGKKVLYKFGDWEKAKAAQLQADEKAAKKREKRKVQKAKAKAAHDNAARGS